MRVPRIYQEHSLAEGQTVELDERAVKHLVQVLRLGVGREVVLFNGKGGEFRAKLIEANKRKASAEIFQFVDVNREASSNIHLAQCVSKGERFEYALQKSVELGVKEITPVISTRSQVRINNDRQDKKLKHWYKIALSACEQSGRTSLVKINQPQTLPDFLETLNSNKSQKLVLDPDGQLKLSNIQASSAYTILIGPEGGFEENEIILANSKNFSGVRLGKQILRTETAPVAAVAALHFLEGEF